MAAAAHGASTARGRGGETLRVMPFHPTVTEEWDADLIAGDPLGSRGTPQRDALAATGESVRTGRTEHYAFIEGRFDVLGGTMGRRPGRRWYGRTTALATSACRWSSLTRTGGARCRRAWWRWYSSPAPRRRPAGTPRPGCCRSPCTARPPPAACSPRSRPGRPARPWWRGGHRLRRAPRGRRDAGRPGLPPGSHTAESVYEHGLADARARSGTTSRPGSRRRWG